MKPTSKRLARNIALCVLVLLSPAVTTRTALAGSQSSTQIEYAKRVDAAIAEVKASREYIAALEKRLATAKAEIDELKKRQKLSDDLAGTLQEKIALLEANVTDLKQALEYTRQQLDIQSKRVLEEMKRTEKAESSKRFWRKVAVIGVAAATLLGFAR